ncbi:MAG TPA: HEAT repeat domain-containing protein [Elusimicrobiota bacterium]|nr:HEAT repeat domain-containing protein [Elusimicrobiota bacterium]
MSRFRKIALAVLVVGFSGVLVLAGGTFYMLHAEVKRICVEAGNRFEGDCVESLIATVKAEELPFKTRNEAIWALGQLADAKALPYLTEIQPKTFCQKPCGNKYLCRYELDKAVKWCTQGNLTRWMYAHREDWLEEGRKG